MTKTLTEQWLVGTLERGYYYYKTKVGAKVIGYQCFGLKFPYDYNHNTIDSVKEVLAPVPSYDEYKELVSKTDELENKLEIATKALKEYDNKLNRDIIGVSFMKYNKGFTIARKALKEMECVK